MSFTLDEILQEVRKLENEQKSQKSELFKICWYMRGGVTLEEVYATSYEDREIIAGLIKENLEITKKSGRDFF